MGEVSRRSFFLGVHALADASFHIRLSGTDPDFTDKIWVSAPVAARDSEGMASVLAGMGWGLTQGWSSFTVVSRVWSRKETLTLSPGWPQSDRNRPFLEGPLDPKIPKGDFPGKGGEREEAGKEAPGLLGDNHQF